jgi:hypothetical protein
MQRHAFLTSALEGGEWLSSGHSRFTPRNRAQDTHRIGGWVGPRAGLEAVEKEKVSAPAGNRNPEPRSSSP